MSGQHFKIRSAEGHLVIADCLTKGHHSLGAERECFGTLCPDAIGITGHTQRIKNSSIKEILCCKGIWFTSGCLFFTLGATITLNTFLPAALVQLYGMREETAATIASMISLGNLIGAVAGPAVYKKMHSFRIFAGLFCVAAAVGCFLGWRIQIPGLSMAAYLVTGIVLGGIMPIYFSIPMILKGISQENVATASGLTTTFQLAGAVIVPSWLITPIAGSNYALIFTLAGVCMVAVLAMATLLSKEME